MKHWKKQWGWFYKSGFYFALLGKFWWSLDKFKKNDSGFAYSNISNLFISLIIFYDSFILKNKIKQTIKQVKADKTSNAFKTFNKELQTNFTEFTLLLTSLFNACVIYKYYSKQFKKVQMIMLCKSKKSDYINSKMY